MPARFNFSMLHAKVKKKNNHRERDEHKPYPTLFGDYHGYT